jgi:hypothetical protein
MNRSEIMQKARQVKKSVLIYEDDKYKIKKVPHNYEILIKLPLKPNFKTFKHKYYSALDYGLDSAHELAKYYIQEYFIN